MTITKSERSTVAFHDLQAVKKLRQLAEAPFDLTKPGNLTPERIGKYTAEACGYKLFYGTERIDDQVMSTLQELAEEADVISKMQKMQSGEVLNFIDGYESEERMVLHTATRDFFNNPIASKEAIELARKEVDKLDRFMIKVDEDDHFTDMIMIGIGGSYLGPEANYLALEHLHKENRRVHFVNNIDPDNLAEVLRKVNLETCLIALVSKTGTTLETMTNAESIRAKIEEAGLKPRKHVITVTMQGSPLDDKRKYLECFYMWDWIGGRYSSTCMVGGVPLAFALGFENFWEFLRGAHAMDKIALNKDIHRNLPLMAALLGIWNRNFLHSPTLAVIPYSNGLRRFPAHIQQLDMESNGKHITQKGKRVDFETGPIIWGEPGSSAQHSFYQLIHQGTNIIPLEFIGYKLCQSKQDMDYDGTTSQEKLLSNLFAQAIALATGEQSDNPNKTFEGNRPSHLLMGRQLTPSSLGALLSFFEHKVAFQGFCWGINSFDQEGVQLGKVLAKKIINLFANKHGLHRGGDYPLGEAFLKQIQTL